MIKFQRLLRVLLALELLGIIYLSIKSPNGGVNVHINDKLGHFIGYGVLSCNTFLVFGFKNKATTLKLLFVLIAIGVILEWVQGFIPAREVSALDVVANAVGVALGTTSYWIWLRIQSRSKRS